MREKGPLQIMFLGTGSDVGKSVIAAGFCRILHRRGLRVAPFKAQNMALNSFVTMDGKEMGRAQVCQAAAAGLLPDADMNPVLLKPSAGSLQIIVQGKLLGGGSADGYYRMKERIFGSVLESYRRLRNRSQALILEGAGSLTEINLKPYDIVNLEMAKAAGAPVVVVADIDRGGVFASLLGTMKLLSRSEKKLVIGSIVNRFRGSMELFHDGVRLIEKLTGRPCFGVVPYFSDIHLPEEDSVALQAGKKGAVRNDAPVRISILHLPHISNYTDFDPLELEKGVSLWYAGAPEDIESASVVIVPGTKNTVEDLQWLHRKGFPPALKRHLEQGRSLIGICGGYQMLGTLIDDPHGVESSPGGVRGLGFLPVKTVLEKEKTLSQVSGHCTREGLPGMYDDDGEPAAVEGYEIHMGKTQVPQNLPHPFTITLRDGENLSQPEGAASPDGLVWGTYLHGLFENDLFRERFLRVHGREDGSGFSYRSHLDLQFEKLADLIERNVDVERLLLAAERFR
jgi:adenosylcobyric acid synthase